MNCIMATSPTSRFSARRVASASLAAVLILGTFAVSANAQGYHNDHRGDDHRGHPQNWNGGYYPAPPVVYGAPYYAPPPVVYGPAVGIVMPGITIGIQ